MAEAQASLDRVSSATIESLRARLLAERVSSKEARQQTEEIAAKVTQLQARLNAETENRRKAQIAMVEVLNVLKTKGIPMEQVMGISFSTTENLEWDVLLNHSKWTKSKKLSFNGVKEDDRDGSKSPPSSQEGQEQLGQSSSEQTNSDHQSCLCEETPSQSSKEGSSSEKPLLNSHFEGGSSHKDSLDVEKQDAMDHPTREGVNLQDSDKDDRGHTVMVEPENKPGNAIMREVLEQSSTRSLVDKTSASHGDLISDASSFANVKVTSDAMPSAVGYARVASGESSSEIGYGKYSLAKQAAYPSDCNSMEAVQLSSIPSLAEETLANHVMNGKFASGESSSQFGDGRNGLAKQVLYPDEVAQRYGDNSSNSGYPRNYAYLGKIPAEQMAYMNTGYIPSFETHPGFNSPINGLPLHKSTNEANGLQMHHDLRMHPLSTGPPFANVYHLGRHGYFPRATYQSKGGEPSMLNQIPKARVSESVLSLIDEKNGKLGDILGALRFAKQQLNDGVPSSSHIPSARKNIIYESSSLLPPTSNSKGYGGYYRDGPYQQAIHYQKPRMHNQAPINHFPISPTVNRGFDQHNGFGRSSEYVMAGNANGFESYHQPRGEVHLGNGITLYTD